MRKFVFGALITVVLLGVLALVERSLRVNKPIPENAPEASALLPEAKLRNIATGEITTTAKFAGKVLLVNFWASWCDACIAEMPGIVKLYSAFRGDGFEVLSINVDENPMKAAPPLMSRLGMTFPVFIDVDSTLISEFEVVAIPYSVVVDRGQKVVWSEAGEKDWFSEKVREEIRQLLRKAT